MNLIKNINNKKELILLFKKLNNNYVKWLLKLYDYIHHLNNYYNIDIIIEIKKETYFILKFNNIKIDLYFSYKNNDIFLNCFTDGYNLLDNDLFNYLKFYIIKNFIYSELNNEDKRNIDKNIILFMPINIRQEGSRTVYGNKPNKISLDASMDLIDNIDYNYVKKINIYLDGESDFNISLYYKDLYLSISIFDLENSHFCYFTEVYFNGNSFNYDLKYEYDNIDDFINFLNSIEKINNNTYKINEILYNN